MPSFMNNMAGGTLERLLAVVGYNMTCSSQEEVPVNADNAMHNLFRNQISFKQQNSNNKKGASMAKGVQQSVEKL